MNTTMVNVKGSHRKFYTVKTAGRVVTTSWGRIGVWTQVKVNFFASLAAAARFANGKLDQKLRRGYVIVNA